MAGNPVSICAGAGCLSGRSALPTDPCDPGIVGKCLVAELDSLIRSVADSAYAERVHVPAPGPPPRRLARRERPAREQCHVDARARSARARRLIAEHFDPALARPIGECLTRAVVSPVRPARAVAFEGPARQVDAC